MNSQNAITTAQPMIHNTAGIEGGVELSNWKNSLRNYENHQIRINEKLTLSFIQILPQISLSDSSAQARSTV